MLDMMSEKFDDEYKEDVCKAVAYSSKPERLIELMDDPIYTYKMVYKIVEYYGVDKGAKSKERAEVHKKLIQKYLSNVMTEQMNTQASETTKMLGYINKVLRAGKKGKDVSVEEEFMMDLIVTIGVNFSQQDLEGLDAFNGSKLWLSCLSGLLVDMRVNDKKYLDFLEKNMNNKQFHRFSFGFAWKTVTVKEVNSLIPLNPANYDYIIYLAKQKLKPLLAKRKLKLAYNRGMRVL